MRWSLDRGMGRPREATSARDAADARMAGETPSAPLRAPAPAVALAFVPFLVPFLAASALSTPAFAQDAFVPRGAIDPLAAAQFALFAGSVLAIAVFAWRQMVERRALTDEASGLRRRVGTLSRDNMRLTTLADARDRRIVLWSATDGEEPPALFGDLPAETGAPADRATFLGFGRWLRPHSAGLLEHAVAQLRDGGTPFDLALETAGGTLLEVEGRSGGGGHFVRFQPAHASRRVETEARARAERATADLERARAALDALPHPAWTRDRDGGLDWCNAAFARAAGAPAPGDAVASAAEILPEPARATVRADLAATGEFNGRLTAAGEDADGRRTTWRVTEAITPTGTGGIALDVTDTDAAENALADAAREHADTLDRLPNAIATFGPSGHLTRWNRAFEAVWRLDGAALEAVGGPSMLLDRLRAEGVVADTPDWRDWKRGVLREDEPYAGEWHLPDGRLLHVAIEPRADGGSTWLVEDRTEQRRLAGVATETQRMRDMSLENLDEGIALFGPDGQLKLSNPALGELWGLAAERREPGTHVSAIAAACADAFDRPSTLWAGLTEDVTSFSDRRGQRSGRIRLRGDRVLAWASRPLPAGQTLLTFVDVSDTMRVADALEAKAEALQRADGLKNALLGHVSYELRQPLTNVIGFTDLLAQGAAGPLTETQAEYVDLVQRESVTLRENVDDIVDFTRADLGDLPLDREPTGVEDAIAGAVVALEDQLVDNDLVLDLRADDGLGTFEVDPRRADQILRNMLQHAINHTPDGGTLALHASLDHGGRTVVFSVRDGGTGMSPDLAAQAFEPFAVRPGGGRQRGAGLGLAIVRTYVELHGGDVALESTAEGTRVTARLPVHAPPPRPRVAADEVTADGGDGEPARSPDDADRRTDGAGGHESDGAGATRVRRAGNGA